MTADEILDYCAENLSDVMADTNWGERAIFYNPGGRLKKGVYILTVKERDGANDRASRVDRPGVYRVNLGVRRETFRRLFTSIPRRPAAGGVVDMDYDFARPDTIMPHPVYAWMGWICVLNPSESTFERLKPLIEEAHSLAKEKFLKRKPPTVAL